MALAVVWKYMLMPLPQFAAVYNCGSPVANHASAAILAENECTFPGSAATDNADCCAMATRG